MLSWALLFFGGNLARTWKILSHPVYDVHPPFIPRMVTHHPKDTHSPYPGQSPNIPMSFTHQSAGQLPTTKRMVTTHPQDVHPQSPERSPTIPHGWSFNISPTPPQTFEILRSYRRPMTIYTQKIRCVRGTFNSCFVWPCLFYMILKVSFTGSLLYLDISFLEILQLHCWANSMQFSVLLTLSH